MISDKLDNLIAEAMKNHETEKLEVLRLIKTKFMEYKTAKAGNVLDEQTEASILIKMISQREDSIKQYTNAKRPELAEQEAKEINIIKEFAPKQATDEEIENFTLVIHSLRLLPAMICSFATVCWREGESRNHNTTHIHMIIQNY